MPKKRMPMWAMFTWPLIFLPLIAVKAFGDKIFGAEWNAKYGETFITVYGVIGALVVVVIVFGGFMGPMLSFFGGSPEEKRIRKTGRPARATIIRVGENSGGGVVTVNDQPYLNLVVRVEEGPGAPYEASFDLIIPRAAVPQLQPGAAVMVKVDPRDPRKVVLSE